MIPDAWNRAFDPPQLSHSDLGSDRRTQVGKNARSRVERCKVVVRWLKC
jgi:hypothetical protein